MLGEMVKLVRVIENDRGLQKEDIGREIYITSTSCSSPCHIGYFKDDKTKTKHIFHKDELEL